MGLRFTPSDVAQCLVCLLLLCATCVLQGCGSGDKEAKFVCGDCADLDNKCGQRTCRERFDWLVSYLGKSDEEAMIKVCATDYPGVCGDCCISRTGAWAGSTAASMASQVAGSATCTSHSACAAYTGDCCPTSNGIHLPCCSSPTNKSLPPTPAPTTSVPLFQLVQAHKRCASDALDLGRPESVDECAKAVLRAGGQFFDYGKKNGHAACYMEKVGVNGCTKFEKADWCRTTLHVGCLDFYKIPKFEKEDSPLKLTVPGSVERFQSLEEFYLRCDARVIDVIANAVEKIEDASESNHALLMKLWPDLAEYHPLHFANPAVFDAFTYLNYMLGKITVSLHKNPIVSFEIPTRKRWLDSYGVYGLQRVPTEDIDPGRSLQEKILQLPLFEECGFAVLRNLDWNDNVQQGDLQWANIVGKGSKSSSWCPDSKTTCSKQDFTDSIFAGESKEGNPLYPRFYDLSIFKQSDGTWDDTAETFLAFGNLGAHRVLPTAQYGASYVARFSRLAGFQTRRGFAKLGADMYFNDYWEPVAIETPDGRLIEKSHTEAATWNYWKFVWRSSLFFEITALDHLWRTHFNAANALAAATRETLPPNHALRRLLTRFTAGTIEVNKPGLHQLAGPGQILHRSSGLADFYEVSKFLQKSVGSLKANYGFFVSADERNKLNPVLREKVGFYQDGQLLFDKLKKLIRALLDIYSAEWFKNDQLMDEPSLAMYHRFWHWSLLSDQDQEDDEHMLGIRTMASSGKIISQEAFSNFLAMLLFAVSGYHRQVGTIADLGRDPDFASWAVVPEKAYAPPRQHIMMQTVVMFTAKTYPKCTYKFDHLAEGLPHETQVKALFNDFVQDMRDVSAEIKARNEQRLRDFRGSREWYAYRQMDPSEVECALSV